MRVIRQLKRKTVKGLDCIFEDGACTRACLIPMSTHAGDIIFLQTGDVVPADAKLLRDDEEKSSPLTVDEAILTGQSSHVEKNIGDLLFMGSTVKQGEHRALVYATGMLTAYHMVRVPARQALLSPAYGMALVHSHLQALQAPHAVAANCGKAADPLNAII